MLDQTRVEHRSIWFLTVQTASRLDSDILKIKIPEYFAVLRVFQTDLKNSKIGFFKDFVCVCVLLPEIIEF